MRLFAWVLLAAVCWPVVAVAGVAILPVYLCAFVLVAVRNILVAASFSVPKTVKLCTVIAQHLCFVVSHAPLMATVLWYYVVRAPLDNVRKDVPYMRSQRRSRPPTPLHRPASPGGSERLDGDAQQQVDKGDAASISSAEGDNVAMVRLDVYHFGSAVGSLQTPVVPTPTTTTTAASSDAPASPAPQQPRLRPVVIFVYGGAFGSGNKWYYAKLAAKIRSVCDAVVVVPDYEYWPTTCIPGMLRCIDECLRWTHRAIARYGGDPDNITFVGHSAGAHLCATYAIHRAMAEMRVDFPVELHDPVTDRPKLPMHALLAAADPVPMLSWRLRTRCNDPPPHGTSANDIRAVLSRPRETHTVLRYAVRGMVLFNGVYDLVSHVKFEDGRGVAKISPLTPATGGHWGVLSPSILLRHMPVEDRALVLDALPERIDVCHAEHDTTVPMAQSNEFAHILTDGANRSLSSPLVQSYSKELHGVSHADTVLGPLKQERPLHPTLVMIAQAVRE